MFEGTAGNCASKLKCAFIPRQSPTGRVVVPRGGLPRSIGIRSLSDGGTPFYPIWALGFWLQCPTAGRIGAGALATTSSRPSADFTNEFFYPE